MGISLLPSSQRWVGVEGDGSDFDGSGPPPPQLQRNRYDLLSIFEQASAFSAPFFVSVDNNTQSSNLTMTMTPAKAMLSIGTRRFHRPFPLPSIFSGTIIDNSFAPPRRASTNVSISVQVQSPSLTLHQQQHHSFVQRRHFHPTYQGLQGDLNDLCKNHIELPVEDFADGCRKFHIFILFYR